MLQHAGLRKECIILTNTSSSHLQLRPCSRCHVLAHAGSFDQFSRTLEAKLRSQISQPTATSQSVQPLVATDSAAAAGGGGGGGGVGGGGRGGGDRKSVV